MSLSTRSRRSKTSVSGVDMEEDDRVKDFAPDDAGVGQGERPDENVCPPRLVDVIKHEDGS